MASTSNGKANTVKTTFSRQTSVSIDINADAAIVWALLTKAEDYPRWNTTIISIVGSIAAGQKIELRSTLDPKRTFKLTVKEFEPCKKLVWGDFQGNRRFLLDSTIAGSTTFSMTEKIGGLMFPLYAGMIPSFDESFGVFAANLKREAELIMNEK